VMVDEVREMLHEANAKRLVPSSEGKGSEPKVGSNGHDQGIRVGSIKSDEPHLEPQDGMAPSQRPCLDPVEPSVSSGSQSKPAS
jgi:hypothetical protein